MTLGEFDKLPKMYVLCYEDDFIAVFEDHEEAEEAAIIKALELS